MTVDEWLLISRFRKKKHANMMNCCLKCVEKGCTCMSKLKLGEVESLRIKLKEGKELITCSCGCYNCSLAYLPADFKEEITN